jgi:hypothetical protein
MVRFAPAAFFCCLLSSACPARAARPHHGRLEETQTGVSGGLCDAEVAQHSGYYKVESPGSVDKHYFYWQFDARNSKTSDYDLSFELGFFWTTPSSPSLALPLLLPV